MDKIHVAGMKFYSYHGVFPEETKLGQRFEADVTLHLHLEKAGQTDDLEYSVNYAAVYETCKAVMEGKPVKLLETLAETIASNLLGKFSLVESCVVKIIKPDPPIPGHYNSVAVEITRGRSK